MNWEQWLKNKRMPGKEWLVFQILWAKARIVLVLIPLAKADGKLCGCVRKNHLAILQVPVFPKSGNDTISHYLLTFLNSEPFFQAGKKSEFARR